MPLAFLSSTGGRRLLDQACQEKGVVTRALLYGKAPPLELASNATQLFFLGSVESSLEPAYLLSPPRTPGTQPSKTLPRVFPPIEKAAVFLSLGSHPGLLMGQEKIYGVFLGRGKALAWVWKHHFLIVTISKCFGPQLLSFLICERE